MTALNISHYFDPAIWDIEKKFLTNTPKYVGHELMVPNKGDYYVLPWTNNAQMLVRMSDTEVSLVSNICKHRQALMLEGTGNASKIVCPLHQWAFNLDGTLAKAPLFEETPCVKLKTIPTYNVNGMLFVGSDVDEDVRTGPIGQKFKFDGYSFDSMTSFDMPMNWKTFVEVFAENYHVNPYHPGLSSFVDTGTLKFEFGKNWHTQYVGMRSKLKSKSQMYDLWFHYLKEHMSNHNLTPEYGYYWGSLYPTTTLEHSVDTIVVSHIVPISVDKCINVVEFYFKKGTTQSFRNTFKRAYLETAKEDEELNYQMQRGRQHLWDNGENEVGPFQNPIETAMEHNHLWFLRKYHEYFSSKVTMGIAHAQ